jgi:hypothetical protein
LGDGDLRKIRFLLLEALSRIHKKALVSKERILPGWIGVYKGGISRVSWQKPLISRDGSKYSQTFSDGMMGGMTSYSVKVTLAREPGIAERYSDKNVLGEPSPPSIYMIENRRVLVWKLKKKQSFSPTGACATEHTRTVVILASDKVWIRDHCDDSMYSITMGLDSKVPRFSKRQSAIFERAELALNRPPRRDFRRRLELFKDLKSRMSRGEVWEVVGRPDEQFSIGNRESVSIYELLDGTKITLKFSSHTYAPRKFAVGLESAIHQLRPGQKMVELVKRNQ